MRKLIITATAAALLSPLAATTAFAHPHGYDRYYGYDHDRYGRKERKERRECRRELRRADSHREYRRELRECRREIAKAVRKDRRRWERRNWHRHRYDRDRYRGYYGW